MEGETLYFMKKGTGLISAKATVKAVQNYIKLSKEESFKIIMDNQSRLNLTEKQIERLNKKCLCLVEFGVLEKITPLEFDHQSNMNDWLIIEK